MVKTLHIHGGTGDSTILVGETLANLKRYIPSEKVVIITDSDVGRLYQEAFPPFKTSCSINSSLDTIDITASLLILSNKIKSMIQSLYIV